MNDPFTLAERLALTAELAALAGEVGSSELAYNAAVLRTGALLESGDSGGAERALANAERLAGELRQPFYMWFARMERTMLAVMRGTPDAEAQVLATFELGTAAGQPDAPGVFGAQMYRIRHEPRPARRAHDAVRANVEAMPHMPVWRAALTWLYSETDQVAAAREQVDILRINGFDHPPSTVWGAYMVYLSGAVCDLHDPSAAAAFYDRLHPVAGQVFVVG